MDSCVPRGDRFRVAATAYSGKTTLHTSEISGHSPASSCGFKHAASAPNSVAQSFEKQP